MLCPDELWGWGGSGGLCFYLEASSSYISQLSVTVTKYLRNQLNKVFIWDS